MKIYLNGLDAVGDMHQQGFVNDFQLFGQDLYWVQRKIFIRAHEFYIGEYHRIQVVQRNMEEFIVFGIFVPHLELKGILLNHYKSYTNVLPTVLRKKLNELRLSIQNNYKEDF